LSKLYLGSSRITGNGLPQLAPLQSLQYLSLKQLPIDDAKLATLPDFPLLQYLGLDGTRLGDEGLKTLARYPQLQVIWLDNTPITDAGLVNLLPLAKLQTLYLPGTQTGGQGLAELRALPRHRVAGRRGAALERARRDQPDRQGGQRERPPGRRACTARQRACGKCLPRPGLPRQ